MSIARDGAPLSLASGSAPVTCRKWSKKRPSRMAAEGLFDGLMGDQTSAEEKGLHGP